jgi:hypothetical protein
MKKSLTSILSAAAFLFSLSVPPAQAGDEHDHAGQHGGKIVESGHHNLEIVAKDGSLEIYVTGEDGKPEDVTQAKATAAVLSEGKKIDLTLAPQSPAMLKGTGSFVASSGTIIVVTLTMPDHHPEQSRIKLD